MRSFTILSAAALLLAACAPASEQAPPADAVQEQVARLLTTDTRTVLAGEAALALTHQCSRISPGPVESQWTPTAAELDEAEDALILLLSQQLEAAGQSPSPGDYYRQYAGFVIGGRRVIYVNGVSEGGIDVDPGPAFHPGEWRTHAIQICDGGTMTFGAEYDVETKAFSNFVFNGAI
ncbi:hypothetical protein [Terricaulis sp.]|uniref:hypothetical protein n=1 Tax=Terricaulis sp. TaxID=2768686 RepID=UPI003784CC82